MQITERTHAELSNTQRTENLLISTPERGGETTQHWSCCLTLPPVVNNYQAWSIETEQQERQKAENQRRTRVQKQKVEHFHKA